MSGMSDSCDLADMTEASDPASFTRLSCSDIPSRSCEFHIDLSACMHARAWIGIAWHGRGGG